jgi:hypothetical protein
MSFLNKKPNIKPINQVPKQVWDVFQNSSPKYIVCCIKDMGQNNLKNDSFHCASREIMLINIAHDTIKHLKIWEVGKGELTNQAELQREAREFVKQEKEKADRKVWEELNKRFGKSEPIAVNA